MCRALSNTAFDACLKISEEIRLQVYLHLKSVNQGVILACMQLSKIWLSPPPLFTRSHKTILYLPAEINIWTLSQPIIQSINILSEHRDRLLVLTSSGYQLI